MSGVTAVVKGSFHRWSPNPTRGRKKPYPELNVNISDQRAENRATACSQIRIHQSARGCRPSDKQNRSTAKHGVDTPRIDQMVCGTAQVAWYEILCKAQGRGWVSAYLIAERERERSEGPNAYIDLNTSMLTNRHEVETPKILLHEIDCAALLIRRLLGMCAFVSTERDGEDPKDVVLFARPRGAIWEGTSGLDASER